jgi:hypothetical protein
VPVPDQKADEKDKKKADGELSSVVQLVKDYARQETLGPLKGWGRYILFGVAGAMVLGLGIAVSMLGLLRMLQTETDWFDGPSTSILAYLITFGACIIVVGLAAWQIKRRTTLQRKEPS